MEKQDNAPNSLSNTPVLQYSITPFLQYSSTPFPEFQMNGVATRQGSDPCAVSLDTVTNAEKQIPFVISKLLP